jgi:hypothetical protein
MASDSRPTRPSTDGVRVVATRAGWRVQWLLATALALLAVVGYVIVRVTRAGQAGMQAAVEDVRASLPPAAVTPPVERVPTPPPVAASEPVQLRPRAAGVAARQEEAKEQVRAKEREEPTFTTLAPGEKAGLAVFPPPGTKPVRQGIVVPDDFELPEGYVRHYQTTDDGRRLPPVLMFHPDYELLDANGNPVPLPEDRIVPPDMVPKGMPIRKLDDPDHVGTSERPGGMVGGPPPTNTRGR